MNKIIETNKLSKTYNLLLENPTLALKDIDFVMEKGDFVCIMGPSGAGKSTLLNCLSLIDIPTKGQIKIDDVDIIALSSKQQSQFRYQKIGFVFQETNLLHYLTLFDNIAFPLTLFNESKSKMETRVMQVAKDVGIEELLNKYPFECSGGQLQRAGICRAIINNPELLISDEPTGNLDSKNAHEIMKLFQKLNTKGMSILMVTHDPIVASYSNQVIYIKDGEIKMKVERQDKSQSDYFYEIVKMNSQESLEIIK